MSNNILMTTGSGFEGYHVVQYLGVISKEIIFRNGVFESLGAVVTDFANRMTFSDTELTGSTELIANGKDYLLGKFEEEVRGKGANAVLGIDFESSFGVGFIHVAMSGTAVIVEEEAPHNTSIPADSDEKGNIRLGIISSNVVEPFIPIIIEYKYISKGMLVALGVRAPSEIVLGDIQADLCFTNRFQDTYIAENCCFLDFESKSKNYCLSGWYLIDIPEHIGCCLESCSICVKKHFLNSILHETASIDQIVLDTIEMVDQHSPIGTFSLLQTFEQFENAQEMLEYVQDNQSAFGENLYNQLCEKLRARWNLERMYGANKKSTLAVIRKLLTGDKN